ncbi:DUF1542 domain-containing protein [Streptococcus pseudopneumoniae]|uniref:DUF1542 domain-containing protein n=2 Tax=Streptococcus pseudopneumoniae TaxID=257758 RepID=UPI0018B09F48|nr:DUF1542 domain-containing protein [Streptococcus pseudopneumoniae]MBF9653107.1 DUF1542 domain-containing protein [Streptococcus pseudopneumoniae]
MFYSEKDDREKQIRFSIRKVSFGAASVAVAALYLFMGSGAVSAAEAQAIQSNEEVAADKDSETEKKSEDQQLTYAAPAAKEQGSATNTEAGDKGKQESHPETKEEEANSSEQSEPTTKTQSDENSVNGDSSSAKSTEDSEATKSEEASSKPKVRKRRDTDSALTATATYDDPAANQTYQAPSEGANVEELAKKLKELPKTVDNEKKLPNIDDVGNTKNIQKGQVTELDEFGGWKAVSGGKFGVARKTDRDVFPIETVNTVRTDRGGKDQTWLNESSFDRSNNYALFLGLVRTEATKTEEVDDGSNYTQGQDSGNKGKGLKNFKGIEKTFKNYSPSTGSDVTVSFYTGITGDIDGNKAGYKVEVVTKTAEGTINTIYSQSFYPQHSSDDEYKKVEKLTLNSDAHLNTTRSTMESQKTELTMKLGEEPNKKKLGTSHGTFTSKNISLLPGVTEYTVSISAADNTKLGMGFQVPWKQYALPVVGNGFAVTQDTSKVAKDLAQKVYDKLTEQKEKDTKWSTPETKAAYEAKLQEIKEKIDSGGNTSDYKTVVEEALKKQKTLNEELKIKRKAADEIAEKAAEKLVMIDDDDTLSENEKDAAKEEVIEDAKKAANNVAVATDQGGVENAKMEGIAEITKVNPVGRDKAKKALDKAAETEKAEINADPSLTATEKEQKVKDLEAKLTEEKGKIDTAADADAVAKAKESGEAAIGGVHTNGDLTTVKNAAKADLDKAAETEKAEINADPSLTATEKEQKVKDLEAKLTEEKGKIDTAADADAVAKAKESGEAAIGGVHTNGDLTTVKNAAKADLAKKLADKLAAIDNTPNATKEEKDAAKDRAKQAANQAIQAINAASDQAGVDKAQADGIAAIAAVNPVAKDKAKAAVAAKLKEKEAEIDANANLSDAEKAAAKEQAKQAADKAIQAIDAASDQAGVDKAQADGIAAIAAVNPVAKDKAKAAVAAKLKEKEAEIDANANLSDAEKAAAKEQAKQAADKAIQAIDAASDQAGVDKAQADGIAAVAAVTPVAKDKAKEAALPNTGSRSDSTTAALGLLSIFGAVGLLFSKKKKDDEEA